MTILLALPLFAQISTTDISIAAVDWRFVPSQSGPTNYYSVVTEDGRSFLRSSYKPPMKTAVMGWQAAEADRPRIKRVRWTWRARTLPAGGDECASGKEDSAAVVYLAWKRGLRYYSLKYVWSAVGTKGKVCDSRRNPFLAQDTILLESGGPVGAWRSADVDLPKAFRDHFEGGNQSAAVPDFVGIGLMSDGDQTASESSADFGTFTVSR